MNDKLDKMENKKSNMNFVVDKRNINHDIIHFFVSDDDVNKFLKYLTLRITFELNEKENIVKCYIRFNGRTFRFYPELLVTVIPQLFHKKILYKNGSYNMVKQIYSYQYRNGFSVDLKDPHFNAMYKRITGMDHVSVNYNRDITVFRDPQDQKKYSHIHNAIGANNVMKCSDKDNISECGFIDILIKMINSTKITKNMNSILSEEYNDKVISRAYDHIIRVHGLFADDKAQENLKSFFLSQCDACLDKECNIIKQHSLSQRENVNGATDTLFHYLRAKGITNDTIEKLQKMLIQDEYESDAIRYDLETPCNIYDMMLHTLKTNDFTYNVVCKHMDTESSSLESLYNTIHVYLLHGSHELYRIKNARICAQPNNRFSSVVHEKKSAQSLVCEIDFGESVLLWLKYDESATFKSFDEEIIYNPYSTISATGFESFRDICTSKCVSTRNQERLSLNEIISLKLYTDTTEYQSYLRRAGWSQHDTESHQIKLNFYHWAITLYRAFLYASQPPQRNPRKRKVDEPMTLYHGLNKVFVINNTDPKYFGIFSTSYNMSVAVKFSDHRGLLWSICASYSNLFNFVTGINSRWFSCFPEECEFILYNQTVPIYATKNFASTDNEKYDIFMQQILIFTANIFSKRHFCARIGIAFNKEWISRIKTHPFLYKRAANGYPVIGRLIEELKILNAHDYDDDYCRSLQQLRIENGCLSFINSDKLRNNVYSIQYILKRNDDTVFYEESFDPNGIAILDAQCVKYHILMRNAQLFGIDTYVVLKRDQIIHKKALIEVDATNNAYCIMSQKLVKPNDEEANGVIRMKLKTITIEQNGEINCVGCGDSKIGRGETTDNDASHGGGGYGSKGSSLKQHSTWRMSKGGKIYGNKYLNVLYHGSPSGHKDSRGGGIIELIATDSVINYGIIDCSAKQDLGGSGGSIKIQCKTFKNFGLIVSNGGDFSYDEKLTGDGGFGRIAIYCAQYVNEGTIYPMPYIKRVALNSDFGDICFSKIAIDTEEKESNDIHAQLIDINQYFYSADVNQDNFFHFLNYSKYIYQYKIQQDLIISSSLNVQKYNWYPNFGGVLQIHSFGTICIEKNGIINGNGMGHHHRERTFINYYYEGPGVGQSCSGSPGLCHGGGSYGSCGVNFEKAECGEIFGTQALDVLALGSPSGYIKSRGGCIVELIAQTVINKGCIYCNGNKYGGSGGSIKISCCDFINYGVITAKGGNNAMDKEGRKCIGFGGDGRIAIYCENYVNHSNEGAIIDPEAFIQKQAYTKTLSFTPIAYNENSDIDLLEAGSRVRHQIIYKLISDPNVDVNVKNDDEDDDEVHGATPLFIACKHGRILCVRHLLTRKDIKIEEANNEGKTPWVIAMEEEEDNGDHDHIQVMKMLLNHSNESKRENRVHGILNVNQTSVDDGKPDKSALHFAVKNKSESFVAMLLECDDININQKDKDGKTALMILTEDHNAHIRDIVRSERNEESQYDLNILHLLLKHPNIDVNETDKDGKTALWIAVEHNNTQVVEILVQRSDVQFHIEDAKGDTVFMAAISKGKVEMVSLLLNAATKSDVFKYSNKSGKNALIYAVENERKEMVQFLLTQSAIDMHEADNEGNTAMTIAIKKNVAEIVEYLLNKITGNEEEKEEKHEKDIKLLLCHAYAQELEANNYYIERALAEFYFYTVHDYDCASGLYLNAIEICTRQEHQWRNHLNLAFCYYKDNAIAAAIKESLLALSLDGKNMIILGHLSFYYVKAMKYEKAQEYARAVLDMDPKHRISTAVMANAVYESEKYRYPLETKKFFAQSLELEISDKHTSFLRGDTTYYFKEFDEMVFICLKNLHEILLDGKNSDFELNQIYAEYCYKHKKYSAAIHSYIETIKECTIMRQQHYNYCHLYECYKEIGRLNDAIKYALLALEYRPSDADILSDLGFFYFKTEEYREAIEQLTKANESIGSWKEHKKCENHYFLSKSYFRTGNVDDAIKSMTVAISRWSKDRNMLHDLAHFHFLKGNYTDAITYYERALLHETNSRSEMRMYHQLLICYQKTQNIDESIKYALLILKENEQDADILGHLGILYFKKESYNEAIKYLKTASASKHDGVHDIFLSKCYHKIGDIDEAIASALSAYAYAPDNKDVLSLLGLYYFLKNEYILAVRYSRFALNVDETLHSPNAVLALSLCEMKKYDESIPYFKTALNNMELSQLNQDIGMQCLQTFLKLLVDIGEIDKAKRVKQNVQNMVNHLKQLRDRFSASSHNNAEQLKALKDEMMQATRVQLIDFDIDIDLNSEKLMNLMNDSQ